MAKVVRWQIITQCAPPIVEFIDPGKLSSTLRNKLVMMNGKTFIDVVCEDDELMYEAAVDNTIDLSNGIPDNISVQKMLRYCI